MTANPAIANLVPVEARVGRLRGEGYVAIARRLGVSDSYVHAMLKDYPTGRGTYGRRHYARFALDELRAKLRQEREILDLYVALVEQHGQVIAQVRAELAWREWPV